MKFTLFGGHGGVGSSLLQSLRDSRHECRVLGRDDADAPVADLGHVIYAAGVTGDFRNRPYDTIRAHVSRLARVLESGSFESLLYLSSTRVYRNSGHGSEEQPVLADPSDAESVYDLSKLAGESLCLNHGKSSVRVVRLSNVIDGSASSPGFLSSIVREALSRGQVAFQSTLDSERDFVALQDLDLLLPRISLTGARRMYNVASGVNLTNRVLGELLGELTGCTIRELPGAAQAKHPQIDISRISGEFSFRPTPPLEAIKAAIAESSGNAARH